MKTLCALVFFLNAFAAFAQAPDAATTTPSYPDLSFGELSDRSTVSTPTVPSEPAMELDDTTAQGTPAQIIDTQPAVEMLGETAEELDDVTITGPVAAGVPVQGVSPRDRRSSNH